MYVKKNYHWGEDIPLTLDKVKQIAETLYCTWECVEASNGQGCIPLDELAEGDQVGIQFLASQNGSKFMVKKQVPRMPVDPVYLVEIHDPGYKKLEKKIEEILFR